MTVLLPLVHITVRKESFHFPVFFYSSISTPQGISIKLLMYFNNLTLNTHSYKDIAHVHVNIEPKGYYFKRIYRQGITSMLIFYRVFF